MELYDIIMIVVLAGTTVFGFWKGMAWQLTSLGSIVLAYFVSLRFRGILAEHIQAEQPWNTFVAMLALFLATWLLSWIAFRFVAGFIDRVKLKEFDRQLGAVFGAAKGVVLCVVISFFALTLSADSREHILQSRSGHYIAKLIDRADTVMPEEIHQVLGPYLHRMEKGLDPNSNEEETADHYHGQQSPPEGPVVEEAKKTETNDSAGI